MAWRGSESLCTAWGSRGRGGDLVRCYWLENGRAAAQLGVFSGSSHFPAPRAAKAFVWHTQRTMCLCCSHPEYSKYRTEIY